MEFLTFKLSKDPSIDDVKDAIDTATQACEIGFFTGEQDQPAQERFLAYA